MNIHEHQAKEILREYGAPVSQGVVVFSLDKIKEEVKKLSSKEFVLELNPRWRKRKSRRSKVSQKFK